MTNRTEMHDRLTAVHSFPDTYMFKVIGNNTDEFISRVVQAAINVMGRSGELDVETQESRAGRHVSVTLWAHVDDADTVLDAYELLHCVQGVRFLV